MADHPYNESVRPVVARVLTEIDKVLSRCDEDSEALWGVLTALRGPDGLDRYAQIKYNTTVPIRTAALPKTAKRSVDFGLTIALIGGTTKFNINDHDTDTVGWHFIRHAKVAAAALGLIKPDQNGDY